MDTRKAEEGDSDFFTETDDEDGMVPAPGEYYNLNAEDDRYERVSGKSFKQTKAQLLDKIVPISLIPMSTANLMLIMGSNNAQNVDESRSCDYDLPKLLLLTGIVSTGMVLMGVVSEHILEWILENRTITYVEQCIICVLGHLGNVLAAIQICILLAGTVLAATMAQGWQYTDRSKGDFCEYGITVFSAYLLGITWVFVIFAAGAFIYIKFLTPVQKS